MLNEKSASLYYELTVIEYDIGLIGLHERQSRFGFLVRHGGKNYDRLKRLIPEVPPMDEQNEPEGESADSHEWRVEESHVLESNQQSEHTTLHSRRLGIPVRPPELLIMRFCTSALPGGNVPGARIWQFHQTDVDPHPSVPHGHEAKGGRRKLDAYRGFVFQGSRQVDREPRQLIVALWNDSKFRDFARKAILWYMTQYPGFHWRVSYPSRLPRRRP